METPSHSICTAEHRIYKYILVFWWNTWGFVLLVKTTSCSACHESQRLKPARWTHLIFTRRWFAALREKQNLTIFNWVPFHGCFQTNVAAKRAPKEQPWRKPTSIRLPGSETHSSLHGRLTTASGKAKTPFSKESTHQNDPETNTQVCINVQDKTGSSAHLVGVSMGLNAAETSHSQYTGLSL